ncbi:TPA: hypothetical protein LUK53_002381 [Escherichia coli]|nr:hypothetical protein [Escherichia coli]
MNVYLWLVRVIASGLVILSIFTMTASGHGGSWSHDAIALYDGLTPRAEGVNSPDGKMAVVVNNESLALKSANTLSPIDIAFSSGLVEILWSADPRYFTITTSDGGWVGTWDTYVIDTKNLNQLKIIPIRPLVEGVLTKTWMCDGEEEINIGGISWGNNLHVLAEVPPHSSCKNMGQVKGIIIDMQHEHIVQTLDNKMVHQAWKKQIGERFND